jgi:Uma2 family endonuclease
MATKSKLTYEDYGAFPDDGNRYEIIDGEVYVTAAPSVPHQRAMLRLSRYLDEPAEQHNLGHRQSLSSLAPPMSMSRMLSISPANAR